GWLFSSEGPEFLKTLRSNSPVLRLRRARYRFLSGLLRCFFAFVCPLAIAQAADVSWRSTVLSETQKPTAGAVVELTGKGQTYRSTSDAAGQYAFHDVAGG